MLFLVTAAFGCATPMAFLQCAAGLTLLALLYFGIATLCAMATGHLLALPVFYFLLNFLAVLLDLLLATFTGEFLFGVVSDYSGAVEWLSPTVYLYRNLSYENIWEQVGDSYAWTDVQLHGMPILLAYGLVGIVLLAMEKISPTVRPRTAALMEGVRPSDRSAPVTRKTQLTLASCSKRAQKPAFQAGFCVFACHFVLCFIL